MSTVRFACASCGQALTKPVETLPSLPERVEDDFPGFQPTVPPGSWALDPDPMFWDSAGRPTTTKGCAVLNATDMLDLTPHPDLRRNSGCCGHDGLDGPNVVCPSCGNEVATLRDDCWSYVEVRLEPASVTQHEVAN